MVKQAVGVRILTYSSTKRLGEVKTGNLRVRSIWNSFTACPQKFRSAQLLGFSTGAQRKYSTRSISKNNHAIICTRMQKYKSAENFFRKLDSPRTG